MPGVMNFTINTSLQAATFAPNILQIYPSEFGLKRLAEEEIKGPAELITNNNKSVESDSEYEDEVSQMFKLEFYLRNCIICLNFLG